MKMMTGDPCSLMANVLACEIVVSGFDIQRRFHVYFCTSTIKKYISPIVLLWTPTHGQAKAGRPARTYIQQLCEDTGCNAEDLPEAMNDREKWREMVTDIRAGGMT